MLLLDLKIYEKGRSEAEDRTDVLDRRPRSSSVRTKGVVRDWTASSELNGAGHGSFSKVKTQDHLLNK